MPLKNTFIAIITFIVCVIVYNQWPRGEKLPLIGIVQISEHAALDECRRGIMSQLTSDGFMDKKNVDIVFESAQGNAALASQITQKYIGRDAKMIIAIGTTAAQSARQNVRQYGGKQKIIPIVFTAVTDPRDANLVALDNDPTNDYITGVSDFVPPLKSLKMFLKILPNMKRVGVIYNPGEANSVKLLTEMETACKRLKLQLITSPANRSADVPSSAQNLADKVDAYFIDNDNTALSAFEAIARIAGSKKIPLFVSDIDLIGQGALAAFGPDQYELGRQTGKIATSIINGETKASDIVVQRPNVVNLVLNNDVAKQINVAFSKNVQNIAKKQYP